MKLWEITIVVRPLMGFLKGPSTFSPDAAVKKSSWKSWEIAEVNP
jgi:hypothetical protein